MRIYAKFKKKSVETSSLIVLLVSLMIYRLFVLKVHGFD